MALTSSPFHPVTNALLPGYRDAYLRGDLSRTNTARVDAHLLANAPAGDEVLRRFHKLRAAGHRVQPVGWVAQQFQRLRTASARFRQRAGGLLAGAVLVSGLAFAGSRGLAPAAGPGLGKPVLRTAGRYAAGLEATIAAMATTTLRGRILDENGAPLVGATVLDKASGRGVSTNQEGNYELQVPATGAARLQYGFGGYHDEEVLTQSQQVQNVTLLPDATKKALQRKKHWWSW